MFKKLAKGKQKIDGRIDLHGMTQERARIALLDFLQASQGQERRIVLVITGKGKSGEGVLRRMVPQWLSLPAFLPLVNGFREASIGHGGEGALYVRLRRRR
ncbi:MAG: Smr/MutS family protein [Ahrensia sp.]|nr:Smr/MutS family protein [Ahrensia sp.]